jgi:hypothetical protein
MLLKDRCTIIRESVASDGVGGIVGTWLPVYPNIQCRLSSSQGNTEFIYKSEKQVGTHKLFFNNGPQVLPEDRVTLVNIKGIATGTVFRILWTACPGGDHMELNLNEIRPNVASNGV